MERLTCTRGWTVMANLFEFENASFLIPENNHIIPFIRFTAFPTHNTFTEPLRVLPSDSFLKNNLKNSKNPRTASPLNANPSYKRYRVGTYPATKKKRESHRIGRHQPRWNFGRRQLHRDAARYRFFLPLLGTCDVVMPIRERERGKSPL